MADRQRGDLAAHQADRLQAGGLLARWPARRRRPVALPEDGRAERWPRSRASASIAFVDGAPRALPARSGAGRQGRDLHRPGDGACASTRSWCSATSAAAVATDENKFSALHYALWNSGTFVYVPRNVVIEQPLQAVIGQSAGKQAGLPSHARRDRGRRGRDAGRGLHRRGRRDDRQRRRAAAGRRTASCTICTCRTWPTRPGTSARSGCS